MAPTFLNDVGSGLDRISDIARGRSRAMSGRTAEEAPGSEAGEYEAFDLDDWTEFSGDFGAAGTYDTWLVAVVAAQTGYVFGFGDMSNHPQNQGRLYLDLRDGDDNALNGKIRLRSRNAVGKNVEDHGTFNVAELRGSVDDARTWKQLVERNMDIIGEDSELYIEFQPRSADVTVSEANSEMYISLTEFS